MRYVIFEGKVQIIPLHPVGRLFGVLQHDSVVTLEDMEQAIADGACEG